MTSPTAEADHGETDHGRADHGGISMNSIHARSERTDDVRLKLAVCEPGQRIVTIDLVALVTVVARSGVDAAWRELLTRLSKSGHCAWRCRALIDLFLVTRDTPIKDAMVLGRDGIVELEAVDLTDVTPHIDVIDQDIDQHALEVGTAIRFLQRHLQHTLDGTVAPRERSAVTFILQAAHWGTL